MLRNKIENLCKEKGISMAELKRRSGVHPGTIKKWNSVKDPGKIGAASLINVAKVLGTTVEYLLE